jgi:hypothetical protein
MSHADAIFINISTWLFVLRISTRIVLSFRFFLFFAYVCTSALIVNSLLNSWYMTTESSWPFIETDCLLMFLVCGWKCTKAVTKSLPWNICAFADISCCAMLLQDRPSTKVQAAPGGGSSLGYLFSGSKDGKWCTPAVSFCHEHGRRLLLKKKKKLVFPWVTIKLLMVVSVLLGLLLYVCMCSCVPRVDHSYWY